MQMIVHGYLYLRRFRYITVNHRNFCEKSETWDNQLITLKFHITGLVLLFPELSNNMPNMWKYFYLDPFFAQSFFLLHLFFHLSATLYSWGWLRKAFVLRQGNHKSCKLDLELRYCWYRATQLAKCQTLTNFSFFYKTYAYLHIWLQRVSKTSRTFKATFLNPNHSTNRFYHNPWFLACRTKTAFFCTLLRPVFLTIKRTLYCNKQAYFYKNLTIFDQIYFWGNTFFITFLLRLAPFGCFYYFCFSAIKWPVLSI